MSDPTSKIQPSCINTHIFYGMNGDEPEQSTDYYSTSVILPPELNLRFTKLQGPSTVRRVFKKQSEVIEFSNKSNCNLMPFAFQTHDGSRLFLAAHPITFWYIDEQKLLNERHTYEIIVENKPCKLYFDLEYDKDVNPTVKGYQMVELFCHFIFEALKNKFNVNCTVEDVLVLDSSTMAKFSCHLIFQNVVFANNMHAGNFVRQICHEIRLASNIPSACLDLLKNDETIKKVHHELLILDKKGNSRLLCDEGVYTKNRHFRLYKSSKFAKSIPLLVSEENRLFIPGNNQCEKEENIFLRSLITYDVDNNNILKYDLFESPYSKNNTKMTQIAGEMTSKNSCSSPFPPIDQCIKDIIRPGKIYRVKYFEVEQKIIYDIVGNRYCGNVERQHKSNNVKYIVNISSLNYYQKCYDPDCAAYSSPVQKLPIDESIIFMSPNIDDSIILEAIEKENSELDKLLNTSSVDESISFDEDEDEIIIKACEEIENKYLCSTKMSEK